MKKPKLLNENQLVEKYTGTIQHFIEDGGWGLRVLLDKEAKGRHYLSKSEANELIKGTFGFLIRRDDCLIRGNREPSAHLLAAYWKFRFNEERKESNRLYSIISEAFRQA